MIKRIGIYLNEMFPVSSILGSILTAISIQLVYFRLYELRPLSYFPLVISGIVITCISLLIRIMDEFKDYQDDLTNFPMRPLPSGRVYKRDLIVLATICVVLVVALSLSSLVLLGWSLIILFFTFLMLKWFFIEERMRKSLPLAFISHHPIVIFNFFYLILACSESNKVISFSQAIYVFPICLIFTNWEVARKIRAPEQETAYTTYSKIFGPRPAIILSLILQLIFTSAVFAIFEKFQTHLALKVIFGILQLALMFPSLSFLMTLKLKNPLKPIAENQILVTILTLMISGLL